MWIAQPSAGLAASIITSERVGWTCIISTTSVGKSSTFFASKSSWIISVASFHTTEASMISSTKSFTPSLPFLMDFTLVDVNTFIFLYLNALVRTGEISSSPRGSSLPRSSTTVTSKPKLFNIWVMGNSTPMKSPPRIIILSGSFYNRSASSEDKTLLPSNSKLLT